MEANRDESEKALAWRDRRLLDLLHIEHPIVLAPMGGFATPIHGRLADRTRLVVKLARPGLPEGPVAVAFPAEALHVFDAATGKRLEPAAAASDAAMTPAA
jgi:hypothetical protein